MECATRRDPRAVSGLAVGVLSFLRIDEVCYPDLMQECLVTEVGSPHFVDECSAFPFPTK